MINLRYRFCDKFKLFPRQTLLINLIVLKETFYTNCYKNPIKILSWKKMVNIKGRWLIFSQNRTFSTPSLMWCKAATFHFDKAFHKRIKNWAKSWSEVCMKETSHHQHKNRAIIHATSQCTKFDLRKESMLNKLITT